jgi:hypothetical protein
MKQRRASAKRTTQLSESLYRRLNAYTLAATAAGVGMLALAQPSEARVIYTRAHQVIGKNGVYELDLNHDGTIDFLIQQLGNTYHSTGVNGLFAQAALGNSVQGSTSHRSNFAAALHQGSAIGASRRFLKAVYPGDIMANLWVTNHSTGESGRWLNVTRRYLGLKFKIDGKTHYGWARLNVQEGSGNLQITATLTGYAYETVPGKEILAGQTASQVDDSSAGEKSAPTSLGTLALGVQGIPLRSRSQ